MGPSDQSAVLGVGGVGCQLGEQGTQRNISHSSGTKYVLGSRLRPLSIPTSLCTSPILRCQENRPLLYGSLTAPSPSMWKCCGAAGTALSSTPGQCHMPLCAALHIPASPGNERFCGLGELLHVAILLVGQVLHGLLGIEAGSCCGSVALAFLLILP